MSSCRNSRSGTYRRAILQTIISVAVLTTCACRSQANVHGSGKPVRIALTNTPLPYLPVVLADALGFYRHEDLSVTIDDFSSAAKVMQALLGGSADVGAGSYEQAIQMAAEGRHVKAFVSILRQPSRVLVVAQKARLKIKRIEDLKGAAIGVAGLGSVNQVFLDYVLLKHGIMPAQVRSVAIGTAASAVAAVQHDMVDAAVLSGSESTVAMRRSPAIQILVDSRGPAACRNVYGVDVYPTAALFANDAWLRRHSEEARRVARAMQSTLAWMATHSAEEVLEATPRRYRMDNKEAELEALEISKASFSRDGIMPAQGAEAVRKAVAFTLVSVRNAHFDLSQTYTNEFVEQP